MYSVLNFAHFNDVVFASERGKQSEQSIGFAKSLHSLNRFIVILCKIDIKFIHFSTEKSIISVPKVEFKEPEIQTMSSDIDLWRRLKHWFWFSCGLDSRLSIQSLYSYNISPNMTEGFIENFSDFCSIESREN